MKTVSFEISSLSAQPVVLGIVTLEAFVTTKDEYVAAKRDMLRQMHWAEGIVGVSIVRDVNLAPGFIVTDAGLEAGIFPESQPEPRALNDLQKLAACLVNMEDSMSRAREMVRAGIAGEQTCYGATVAEYLRDIDAWNHHAKYWARRVADADMADAIDAMTFSSEAR